jgi:hypothetical protein
MDGNTMVSQGNFVPRNLPGWLRGWWPVLAGWRPEKMHHCKLPPKYLLDKLTGIPQSDFHKK